MTDPARSFVLAPDIARWLVSDGLADVATVAADLDAGVTELAVAARLRDAAPSAAHARAVVDAASARRRARDTYPRADELLLTTSALEQGSHPAVSAWRADRYTGEVVDLCAGAGGDALALAAHGCGVTAVDLDEGRLVLLDHNAAVLGLDVATVVADALAFVVPSRAAVHADPGRRVGGRRVRRLDEHLPSVPVLLEHVAESRGIGVALSPAVDLDDPGLPIDGELEFLQVGNRLVETSLWTGELRRPGVVATATLVDVGVTLHREGQPAHVPVTAPGEWLLDPVPALTRARLHTTVGDEVGATRLGTRRALLTVDRAPHPSPWFTTWRVEEVLPLRAKTVRRWLRSVDELPLEISTHGVDADPTTWWRDLGRPTRGPEGRRLHLVRTDDGALCLATVPG